MPFEVGHNEIGDADDPQHRLSSDLGALFVDIGLPSPRPVPLMRIDHPVAEKLHAVSAPGNQRARDLVDLQLLDRSGELDPARVRDTCSRLFAYRRRQPWPPTVVAGDDWDTLYRAAAEDVEMASTVAAAIAWTNEPIQRIVTAEH